MKNRDLQALLRQNDLDADIFFVVQDDDLSKGETKKYGIRVAVEEAHGKMGSPSAVELSSSPLP